MLLNSPALFMEMFNLLIENMEMFKIMCKRRFGSLKNKKRFNEFLFVKNQTCFFNIFAIAGRS